LEKSNKNCWKNNNFKKKTSSKKSKNGKGVKYNSPKTKQAKEAISKAKKVIGVAGQKQNPTIKDKNTISPAQPTKTQPMTTSTPVAPKKSNGCSHYLRFPNFKTFDKEWKDDKMASGKKLEEGALTTIFAMILNAKGKQINGKDTVTPKSLNAWLIANGGYNKKSGLTKQWMAKLGLEKLTTSKPHKNSELRQLICSGKSVILKVKEGYALAVGIDDDGKTFIVNEPSYTSRTKIDDRDVLGAIAFN